MKGKRLPQIGRVEISVIEESNPRLLAFNSRRARLRRRAGATSYAERARRAQQAQAVLREAGRDACSARCEPALAYAYFNMDDPVVGGYTPDKIALRRAMLMGYNSAELIQVWFAGAGASSPTSRFRPRCPATSPGIKIAARRTIPALARALLDKFGYKDRDGDGFRELPDGKPLVLSMGSAPSGRDRIRDELWLRTCRELGVRIEFIIRSGPTSLKMARAGKLQMWPVGWITAYLEGDAFMELLYATNIGQTNYSRFENDEYDELFRQTKQIPARTRAQRMYAQA